jgi:hypothetical protein
MRSAQRLQRREREERWVVRTRGRKRGGEGGGMRREGGKRKHRKACNPAGKASASANRMEV